MALRRKRHDGEPPREDIPSTAGGRVPLKRPLVAGRAGITLCRFFCDSAKWQCAKGRRQISRRTHQALNALVRATTPGASGGARGAGPPILPVRAGAAPGGLPAPTRLQGTGNPFPAPPRRAAGGPRKQRFSKREQTAPKCHRVTPPKVGSNRAKSTGDERSAILGEGGLDAKSGRCGLHGAVNRS